MPAEPGGKTTILSRGGRALPRAAAAFTLLAGMLLTSSVPGASAMATTSDGIETRPFAADSTNPAHGDTCPMGFTSGTLSWHVDDGSSQIVDVDGSVSDRPLPTGSPGGCDEDGHFTQVLFRAHDIGGGAVGSAFVSVGTREFPATLALRTRTPIAYVTVQVARLRTSPPPSPPSGIYWGPARTYFAPILKI